jgi:HEAT repeat protein
MPIVIAVTTADGATTSTTVTNDQREQTFDIPAASRPIMVLFDPGHNILSKVTFKKTDAELLYQMKNAPSVLDRLEAAQALLDSPKPTDAQMTGAVWFLDHEPFADARVELVDSLAALAPDRRAADALRGALTSGSAHVRSAAAQMLGSFPSDPRTIAALQKLAAGDPSYATIASSVRSLADLKAPNLEPVLARALGEPSNNGEIASAGLYGYARMEKKGAIPLEERYARYGAPLDSRGAAIRALGRIGKGDPKVTAFLTALLGDPSLFTNFGILASLADLGDPAALPAVERLAATTTDDRLRQGALETVATIQAQVHKPKKPGARASGSN